MPHFQLTVSIGTHSATTPWCQVGPQVIPSASCAILHQADYWLYHKTRPSRFALFRASRVTILFTGSIVGKF